MQGLGWTILKGTWNYGDVFLGLLWPSVGEAPRKLIALSRFDDSYSEPTVHCHYIMNILFLPFSSTYSPRHWHWFSIQNRSPDDDWGIFTDWRCHSLNLGDLPTFRKKNISRRQNNRTIPESCYVIINKFQCLKWQTRPP